MARHATSFLSDFREFIQRGNVVDLAVAVVIGTAFSKIVDSFVSDVITPAILTPALQAANVDDLSQLTVGTIRYGSFLAAILNFIVIALSIFVLIRMLEAAKRRVLRQEEVVEEVVEPLLLSQERLTTAVERLSQVIESR